MDRWQDRVAVVTGASSGIGAACCKYLVERGMVVVGLARRQQRIEALRNEVKSEYKDRLHAIACDVSKEEDVRNAFAAIESKYGPVAVLVNNAGIARQTELVRENNTDDLRAIIDTNVMGVAYCTREAFRSMKTSPTGDGHIFLINSVAGHKTLYFPNHSMNMYSPSKFAITAMAEVYRQEFVFNNTKIKITSISPGLVDTEIISDEARKLFDKNPILQPGDIADALVYCLQTPPNVQIHELTIKPVGEPF